jgi:hypothetical protein
MSNSAITLSVQVDEDGRKQLLQSGQKICIVRVLEGEDDYVVACAAFLPFGPQTDILFYPEWSVYVMQGGITTFEPVNMQITGDLEPGQQCTFDGSGFSNYEPAWSEEVFGLINNTVSTLVSAGLAQKMNISNLSAFSAININALPANEISFFQPKDDIRVFIAKGVESGMVLPASLLRPAQALKTMVASVSSIGVYLTVSLLNAVVIHFDNVKNCFAPGPLSD